MENREGGLEPKCMGVQRAKEGGNVTNSQLKTEERAARAGRCALQGVRGGKAGGGGKDFELTVAGCFTGKILLPQPC